MSEIFKRELVEAEYNAIYNIGNAFKGAEGPRVAATKINEKISDKVRAGVVKKKVTETGKDGVETTVERDVFPEKIELDLTRAELDGYFGGVKEVLKESETRAEQIAIIGAVCKTLGMFKRFSKHTDSVLASIEAVTDDFDENINDEPLDDEG